MKFLLSNFKRNFLRTMLAILLMAFPVSSAFAGPPFLTDDPEPVDLGHWEEYIFSAGTHVDGNTSGTLAGVEVNYGAAPNLQLHLIAPLAFNAPQGGSFQAGPGDLELGAKYRLLNPSASSWLPEIGVFPLIELPSGRVSKGLGAGQTRVFLPVWLQKNVGKWTTYGGGGYWINPGAGNQNYWFAGWMVQQQLTKKFALGIELFHQTPDRLDEKASTGFNVGAIYDFNEHFHLLASAGRGLQNTSTGNEFSYYVALQKTF